MPEVATDDALLAEVIAAIEALGVRQTTFNELWTGVPGARHLVRPKLRLAHHFDIEPDLLIVDPVLGTVGLVHVLCEPAKLEGEVRSEIDRATYTRHLLLVDPARGEHAAYSVELVIVTPADAETRDRLARALRSTAEETQYLHSIGVNVLASPFTSANLRRAFPWLLSATRRWYGFRAASPDVNGTTSLTGLTLENYRVHGLRKVRLSSDHSVHLVHGHNGSGKSSLVEALEYLLTGAVTRIDEAFDTTTLATLDYDHFIRNREATEPARITLDYRGKPADGPFVVAIRPTSAPVPPGVRAASFRLDQGVMDRLARMGAVERHKTLGEAFFPETRAAYDAYDAAQRAATQALQELPEDLRATLETLTTEPGVRRAAAIVDRLQWLESTSSRPNASQAADCLPVPLDALQSLAVMDDGLKRPLEAWTSGPPAVGELEACLSDMDAAIATLRSNSAAHLATLQTAIRALQEWADWAPTTTQPTEDFARTLDTWLEREALLDLAERHYHLARALKDAREHGWQTTWHLFERSTLDEAELDLLRQQMTTWATERDELLNSLLAAQPTVASPSEPGAPPRQRRLSDADIAALNAASGWLGGTGLGDTVRDAVRNARPGSFHDTTIGVTDWATRFIEDLQRLSQTLGTLSARPETAPTGAFRVKKLKDVFDAHVESQKAGDSVSQSFFEQLARSDETGQVLIEATNELMALFTPARFAYEDIALKVEESPHRRLRLVLGEDTDADLLFNTAELNVFTIALFLLCARRVDNRLRLLVLDDPLQNMDELTVTYLARGLAGLVRLWHDDWQLLLLFHGEDELDRFRAEMPSAVYRLPWLTPVGGAVAERTIEADPRSSLASTLQDLKSILAETPPDTST